MALPSLNHTIDPSHAPLKNKIVFFMLVAVLMLPAVAFGQDPTGDTSEKVCGFFQSINGLLNAASIVVVTIAVIFSGYQIAFAHKRISDVAPALVGGVLIGAAAQVAKMVVGGNGSGGTTACTSSSGKAVGMIIDAANAAMHLLHLHA